MKPASQKTYYLYQSAPGKGWVISGLPLQSGNHIIVVGWENAVKKRDARNAALKKK